MRILAIDTSCDETAAAVTGNVQVHSDIVWSQASLHSRHGGVMPSLAQRAHEERIDWVVTRAIKTSGIKIEDLDAVAVTTGPGLAIALGVGINYAREFALKHNLPLIPVNHVEAHLLSPLATSKNKSNQPKDIFPAYGLVLSGGTTLFCKINKIGKYKILAETVDDALGEALDKAARLLGFGYPGASVLEKMAKNGNRNKFELPIPLVGDKVKNRFSYSGLKTAFVRLYDSINDPSKQDVYDLSKVFQDTAFKHIENVLEYQITNSSENIKNMLFGGGVSNNIEIRKRLRKLCKKHGIILHVPYSKKLSGDNAAMIGVAAYLKNKDLSKEELSKKYSDYESVDRNPRLSLT